MVERKYPTWRVPVVVSDGTAVHSVTVDIDAPDELSAEQDATAMLYHGDGWQILEVGSIQALSGL